MEKFFTLMVKAGCLTTVLVCCMLVSGVAQRITINGVVTDESNGEPLPGTTIMVKETTIGTVTDAEGKYSLSVPEDATALVFSFLGYISQEVPINNRSVIDLALVPDISTLQELVVVGYGTQKKVSMVSAVSSVSAEDLVQRSSKNLSSNLQGLAPGLTVLDRGGSPGGSDFKMYIRGVTTLNDDDSETENNNPLVIVDGIEMGLNDVDPNNVASVSVLKDAASTAIYGSRAANGVILITTKRGKAGEFRVSYNASLDLHNLTVVPEHMGTEDYLRLQNVAYQHYNGSTKYTEEDIKNYLSGEDRINYPLPNVFFDEVIRKNAPMQRHSLSISGGTEKLTTNLMLNYFDQEGIYPNQNSQRYAIRMNNDIKISEAIDLRADIKVQRKDRYTFNDEDDVYHRMLHSSQFVVPRYPDGTYGVSPQGHNPLAWTDPRVVGGTDATTDMGLINLEGTWKIIDGLKFTSQYALDFSKHSSIKNIPNNNEILFTGKPAGKGRVQINELKEYRRESLQKTWNNTLAYDIQKGSHGITLLAGYSEISYDYKNLTGEGRDFYNNELRNLKQGDPLSRSIESEFEDWGLRSVFGRVNYAFKDKYLFEANMRYDGSSFFPKGNRYDFFPSVAGAWRISEEAFWEGLKNTVSQFKIRASWGVTGNNTTALYSYFNTLDLLNNYSFNDLPVTAVRQEVFASQNLQWESTTQTNIGMDLSLFEGKMNVTVDWFNKITDDILLDLPIPRTIGLDPVPTNAGSVQNKGWEFQVNYQDNINDFSYGVTLNLSDVKNEVLDLAGGGPFLPGDNGWHATLEEHPIEALYGYKTDGLLTQEDFDNGYPVYAVDAAPGDIKYIDLNGDNEINNNDRTVIGSIIPRLTYGMNLMLGWKNFDFNVQMQGVGNKDVGLYGSLTEAGSWEGFTVDLAKDYWTEDNLDATFPRPQKRAKKNTRPSEWWMVNGAYLRVKNLQLGYTLPAQIIDKVGIDRLRLFVGGTNLFTASELNKWGIDAEMATGRGVFYPATKTYTFGVNLTF